MQLIRWVLVIILLFLSGTGFAEGQHYITLKYQYTTLEDQDVNKNVKKTLENSYSKLHFPLTEHEATRFTEKASKQIEEAVSPYGYFHAAITPSITKKGPAWQVYFNISLGSPILIQSVNIAIEGPGKTDAKFEKFIHDLPLKAGKPLHTPDYEKAKTDLYDIATEHGYFSAKMEKSEIQINLANNNARIIIVFSTGPRARFGPTTFSKTTLNDSFLRKYLTYKQGDLYDSKALEKTQSDLVDSTFFNQVLIEPHPKEMQNGEVPLHIKLTPRRRKEYTFGLGYGTDTGIRGTLGITLRHLNGQGHRFVTLVRASESNSSAVAKYLIPGFDPANDLWTIAAGLTHMSQATGTAHNKKVAVEYSMKRDRWKHSVELAYLNEEYNVITLPQTSTELVYPTWKSKYVNADKPTNPKRGLSFAFKLTGTEKAFLSETSFYQATAHFKSLYTIAETRTRVLFRSDIGRTQISSLDNLPMSLQLFAGGADSVRGYGYNSIGPGKNMLVGSFEVQERVYKDFYFAGFMDAGNVTDGNVFDSMNLGTGPGIVCLTPIGSLELTYGQAITRSGHPWSIQFTMGTSL